MPHLSKKGIELPTSPIRKLVVFSEKAKENGIEVLHLNIGQPDIAAPKEAIKAVTSSNLDLLPYGPSQGTLSYRKKLVEYYNKHKIYFSILRGISLTIRKIHFIVFKAKICDTNTK